MTQTSNQFLMQVLQSKAPVVALVQECVGWPRLWDSLMNYMYGVLMYDSSKLVGACCYGHAESSVS